MMTEVKDTNPIPVIDLSPISLSKKDQEVNRTCYENVGRQISEALSDWGFAYLENHGVQKQHVQGALEESKRFFALPQAIKEKFRNVLLVTSSRGVTDINGYSTKGREVLEDKDTFELKESFDICTPENPDVYPNEAVAGMQKSVASLSSTSLCMAHRILKCMAVDLGEDPDAFIALHSDAFKGTGSNNATCIRFLHYPPFEQCGLQGSVTRCGVHTDYGGLTLIYQEEDGSGLEILDMEGNWTPANPRKDSIVMNVGDLMSFWSGGRYRATPHRVRFNAESVKTPRYSIALFVHPNHDTRIRPLGKDRATDFQDDILTAKEHVNKRFKDTYA